MSWLSKKFTKGVDAIAKVSPADKVFGRKREREIIGTGIGGPQGGMYEYGKNKGMNESEASRNAYFLGGTYGQNRSDMKIRVAEEAQQEAAAVLERRRVAEEARAKGQIAARVRRGSVNTPARAGTVATSPSGLGTTGNFGSFAALLGL